MKNYYSSTAEVYYFELNEKHVYETYFTNENELDKVKAFMEPNLYRIWQEIIGESTSGGEVLSVVVDLISELDYKREAFKPHNKYRKAIRGY